MNLLIKGMPFFTKKKQKKNNWRLNPMSLDVCVPEETTI